MIKRKLEQKIKEALRYFPVISVTGPRQSGKTTLLKMALPDYHYINLENKDTLEFAKSDPVAFLSTYNNKVIFDEVQNAPELFSYIQNIVDESQIMGQFILSGSQNFLLSQQISQSLAGRVGLFTLLPLSINELKEAKRLDPLNTFLLKGAYPPIYDRNIPNHQWHEDYISTYIERDIRQLKNIQDLSQFKKFVTSCAVRSGQLVNLSDLGSEVGISHNTAQSWLSILEASYIITLIYPYTTKISGREIKSPKLLFLDHGLLCTLLKMDSEETLPLNPNKGHIFETMIMSNLLKQHYNHKKRPHIYFWNQKNQREIDVIIELETTLLLIEIKMTQTIRAEHFKHLLYFKENYKTNKTIKSYLIYAGNEKQERSAGTILPWDQVEELFMFESE